MYGVWATSEISCCEETSGICCLLQDWGRTFVSSRLVSISGVLVSPKHVGRKAVLAHLEGAKQALVDTHHCTCVVELAAVVGRAEKRDKLSLREELVAILNDLMSTTDQIHVVLL